MTVNRIISEYEANKEMFQQAAKRNCKFACDTINDLLEVDGYTNEHLDQVTKTLTAKVEIADILDSLERSTSPLDVLSEIVRYAGAMKKLIDNEEIAVDKQSMKILERLVD